MFACHQDTNSIRELCQIITLGQYLSPSSKHLPVARYVHPDEFDALKQFALELGIPHIESGPLVRSSYHADGQAELIRKLAQTRREATG